MQRAQSIVVVLGCLLALGAGKQKPAGNPDPPPGAWLETHLNWEHPSSSANPQLQSSRATILYFGEDHTFAKMICIVTRIPGTHITINDEDGIVLWRGRWTADRKGIAVSYELAAPRARQWPEASIPGPAIEAGRIDRSHDQLMFAEMKFERASELDHDAHHAMLTSSGMRLPPNQ